MGKLSKIELQERQEFSKALQRELKKGSKEFMWQHSRTTLFRNHLGNFLQANISTHPYHYHTLVELKFKPMPLDPLFWDIVLTPENKSLSLSFRAFGAWVSTPTLLEITKLNDQGIQPNLFAASILNWLSEKMEEKGDLSMDDYLTKVEEIINTGGDTSYIASKISVLILQNKFSEVDDLCNALINKNYQCGFTIGNTTFPKLAIKYMENKRSL